MEHDPLRKSMKRREVQGGIRFVTFSTYQRKPLLIRPGVADEFVTAMSKARMEMGYKLYAWVIMPEHVHMMLLPPESVALSRILTSIKVRVAKRVMQAWQRMDDAILHDIVDVNCRTRFWQYGGGFDRNVRTDEELAKEIRYIHRNPIERGLVTRPEDWRWSSVRWRMGKRTGEVECDELKGSGGAWQLWKGYM